MGLKDVLQEYKVPLPEDFDQRFDIIMSGLKKKPDYESKLKAYNQAGGAETNPNDFLNPNVQWFTEAITSPAAQDVLRLVFSVIFFISYLESTPVFGSILSAALDVMVAGSKAFMKTIQKLIPNVVSLIPLPYMNLVGMMIAAMFGFIVWPIVAIVSFSRQDFTAAVDSFVRMIPPPIGDLIGDNFLEVNRMAGRLNAKRQKLADDISSGFSSIAEAATGVSSQVKQGAESLAKRTQEAATSATTAVETAKLQMPSGIMNKLGEAQNAATKVSETVFLPSVPASQIIKNVDPLKGKGRKKLSRKMRSKGKWKTKRNKFARR